MFNSVYTNVMNRFGFLICLGLLALNACKKNGDVVTAPAVTGKKPKANFTFEIKNPGYLPDTVNFTATSEGAESHQWVLDNTSTSSGPSAQKIFADTGTYFIKLIASNKFGTDTIRKQVTIILKKPMAEFDFALSDQENFPVTLRTQNKTTGSKVSYLWSFENETATLPNTIHDYHEGGIYTVKLVAANAAGMDSVSKQVKIVPYLQPYTSFDNNHYDLFAWEGKKVMILSRNKSLNRISMYKWLKVMDSTYNYYNECTGLEPVFYAPTYINNRTTIADVPATCGAGCGYIGFTGIEIQNSYFDNCYNSINDRNEFDHLPFYEFGRNFWFYNSKVENKAPAFPVAGGYAVFMSYMTRLATGVNFAPFGSMSAADIKARVEGMVDVYVADTTLTWANTMGVDQGIPGYNSNGADLFTSFCFRLQRDYGGENFMKSVWKKVGLRPDAITQQDAIDNFFIACSQAANRNLTGLFQSWRWPLSGKATNEALQYPQ